MKKLLALVAFATMTLAAAAQDITIVNTGSKTGGFYLETSALTQDLQNQFKIDYINPGSGCLATAVIDKIDKNMPVLFPWAGDIDAGIRKQGSCNIMTFTEKELIRVHYDSYYICSAKPEMNAARLVTAGSSYRIGHAIPASVMVNSINNGINASFKTAHKPVHFAAGSPSTITAMLNGEVDYGIIESKLARKFAQSGNGTCMYRMSTASADALIPIAAKDLANKNLKVGYYVLFILKNATDAQRNKIQAAMKAAHQNPNSNTAKIWEGSGMQFDWNTKMSTFNQEWEDSVNSLK
jgi:hypothetical protein